MWIDLFIVGIPAGAYACVLWLAWTGESARARRRWP